MGDNKELWHFIESKALMQAYSKGKLHIKCKYLWHIHQWISGHAYTREEMKKYPFSENYMGSSLGLRQPQSSFF